MSSISHKKSRYSNVCWGEHVWCDAKTPNPTTRPSGGSHCVPDEEMGIELQDLSGLSAKAEAKEDVTADPPTQPQTPPPIAPRGNCDV